MQQSIRWVGVALLLLSAMLALAAANAGAGDRAASRDAADRERLITARRMAIHGEPARAESLLRTIVDADSLRPIAWLALNQIGLVHYRAKDYRGAVAVFERRNRLDPNDGDAQFWLGLSHRELGEPEAALAALRRSVGIESDDSTRAVRLFWLGMTLTQVDRNREAEAAFTQSTAADSTGFTASAAFRMRGALAIEAERYREAVEVLERAVRLDERDLEAWQLLGLACRRLGLLDRARDAFERARPAIIDSPLEPPERSR